jgi:Holliday junction resolvasome RuvABC endonuclease subunit
MLFVGIDQSLNAPGLAVVDGAGTLMFADTLKVRADLRVAGQGAARLLAHYAFYEQAFRYGEVTGSALEGPSYGSAHLEFSLGEASGVARLILIQRTQREPIVVPPTLLKKYATKQAMADKGMVVDAVNRLWAEGITDDNTADAIVLAHIARTTHLGLRPATRAQFEAVHAVRTPKPRKAQTRTKRSPENL